MHETCWGGGAAVPWATGGASREGLRGTSRWLLSCVQVCKSYRMTAGTINELLALLRVSARIVLVPSSGLAGLLQLPCEQTCGLCLNADDVADLARRLPCAQTRGLRCSNGAPVPPALRLLCAQACGLCWQPATNFAQHTVLLCAQARVALFGVGGRGRCLSRYSHIASPTSTPSASPHTMSRG